MFILILIMNLMEWVKVVDERIKDLLLEYYLKKNHYKVKIIWHVWSNNDLHESKGVRRGMTISQIQRELKISYKETYRHVKELVEAGILDRVKEKKRKHQPVYIYPSKKLLDKI